MGDASDEAVENAFKVRLVYFERNVRLATLFGTCDSFWELPEFSTS